MMYVPIHAEVDTDMEFTIWAILLMGKVGEKKATVWCLEVPTTNIAIKNITIHTICVVLVTS